MKLRHLTLTLFLTICFSVTTYAQSFQEDIIKYLSINGTVQQYEKAYDEMFLVLRQQYQNVSVPEEVWTDLQSSKEKQVNYLIALLASTYRSHFTKEDIKTMLAFYESEAGKQLVEDYTKLTPEQNAAFSAFNTSEAGKKLEMVRPELAKDISETSEYWSRDLFKNTMQALKDKGYYPIKQ